MSTKAQRLLSEATPLPWGYERSDPQPHSPFFEIAPFDSEGELDWSREVAATADENRHDADLIVYAVNTLPLYEELREAAEEVVNSDEAFNADGSSRMPLLRAILHRLDEGER